MKASSKGPEDFSLASEKCGAPSAHARHTDAACPDVFVKHVSD